MLSACDDRRCRRITTISFDPNCRPNLVRHKVRYVDQMNAFAAAANIVDVMSTLNFFMAQ